MNNKVLVEVFVPDLEQAFDVFLPISKRIGNIINLLAKAINELGIDYSISSNCALYSRTTGDRYESNNVIINTDIRNGSMLVLL